jgi:hypothetical protein
MTNALDLVSSTASNGINSENLRLYYMEDFDYKEVEEDAYSLDDEDDDAIGFVSPRFEAVYVCIKNHETDVPLSTNAEVPPSWDCAICGHEAKLKNSNQDIELSSQPTGKGKKTTPWEKLLERRTEEELQTMLTERLAQLEANGTTRSYIV